MRIHFTKPVDLREIGIDAIRSEREQHLVRSVECSTEATLLTEQVDSRRVTILETLRLLTGSDDDRSKEGIVVGSVVGAFCVPFYVQPLRLARIAYLSRRRQFYNTQVKCLSISEARWKQLYDAD